MTDNKVLDPVHSFSLAILAYLLFTLGDTTGKWLQDGYTAPQILVTINAVGLLLTLVLAFSLRGREAFQSQKWGLHALRGGLIGISTALVLYALTRLPLSEFYGIVFLSPLWVAIISRFYLKQAVPLDRWIAIAAGFVGVLIITGAKLAHFNMGVMAALCASFISAIAALMARKIGGHEPPTNFALATHAAMILVNLPFLRSGFIIPNLTDAGIMVGYGLSLSLAMLAITLVFSRSHMVSQVAPLQYSQMLWGVLLGWLVFGNVPGPNVIIGGLLVIGAGLYILRSLRAGRIMNH